MIWPWYKAEVHRASLTAVTKVNIDFQQKKLNSKEQLP